MTKNPVRAMKGVVFGMLAIAATSCGGSAEGHTYSGNGGVVKIEFKSDGKAYVATGPISTPCSYTEKARPSACSAKATPRSSRSTTTAL